MALLKDAQTITECKKELMRCDSLNEMFDVLDEYYDLDKPLGMITKVAMIASLGRAIKFIKPNIRDK